MRGRNAVLYPIKPRLTFDPIDGLNEIEVIIVIDEIMVPYLAIGMYDKGKDKIYPNKKRQTEKGFAEEE